MVYTTIEVINVKKDYLFYGAFFVGVIALISVMTIYNNKSEKPDIAKEQSIDLDATSGEAEPVEVLNDNDVIAKDEQKQNTTEDKSTDANTQTMGKNGTEGGSSETTETTDTASTENTSEVAASTETQDTSDYTSYNGNQTLTWPVTGSVILPYSMDTTVYFRTLDQYKCNPGMLIAAPEGEDVLSVYAGKVTEVGNNKEFGNYIMMDLGNDYQVCYGQLDQVIVKKGELVNAGDVVATVAKPSSYYTKEGAHLYLAITKADKPVNPVNLMVE